MIGCDTCDDWFHFVCVNVPEEQGDTLVKYSCPNCCAAAGQPYPFAPLPANAGLGPIRVTSPIISVVGTPVPSASPAPVSPASALDGSGEAPTARPPAPAKKSAAAGAAPRPEKTPKAAKSPAGAAAAGATTVARPAKPRKSGGGATVGTAVAAAPFVADVVMPSPDRRDWLPAPEPGSAAVPPFPGSASGRPAIPLTFSAYGASIRPPQFPPLGTLHAVAPSHPYGLHPMSYRPIQVGPYALVGC